MLKQKRRTLKPGKGGRPATGRDPVRAIRLSDEFLAKVDLWLRKQGDRPSRSEAIRRLVEAGLAATPSRQRSHDSGSLTANQMAHDPINVMADKSATEEERGKRKRRLLKGPSEFRKMRVIGRGRKR